MCWQQLPGICNCERCVGSSVSVDVTFLNFVLVDVQPALRQGVLSSRFVFSGRLVNHLCPVACIPEHRVVLQKQGSELTSRGPRGKCG